MPVVAPQQLTLEFAPGLLERFPTAMDALRASVATSAKPIKTIAADMDMSGSTLSRKLNQDPDDPRRFNVDDLEAYVKATGDTLPIQYLAVKYLQSDESRRARALSAVEQLLPELLRLLPSLKEKA
jgi:hypothetical protein